MKFYIVILALYCLQGQIKAEDESGVSFDDEDDMEIIEGMPGLKINFYPLNRFSVQILFEFIPLNFLYFTKVHACIFSIVYLCITRYVPNFRFMVTRHCLLKLQFSALVTDH